MTVTVTVTDCASCCVCHCASDYASKFALDLPVTAAVAITFWRVSELVSDTAVQWLAANCSANSFVGVARFLSLTGVWIGI